MNRQAAKSAGHVCCRTFFLARALLQEQLGPDSNRLVVASEWCSIEEDAG